MKYSHENVLINYYFDNLKDLGIVQPVWKTSRELTTSGILLERSSMNMWQLQQLRMQKKKGFSTV